MLEEMGGDVEGALEAISVPSYVLDSSGAVRWLNPAAERLLGDVRGRHYTSVVAHEETRRARELFTQKVLGTVEVTDTPTTLLNTDGSRVGSTRSCGCSSVGTRPSKSQPSSTSAGTRCETMWPISCGP
jgi:PAS domain-containing protein